MLSERPLHTDVKNLLLSHQPFQYAHLIKFERPSRPDNNSGQVSTSKQRYAYITDASRDVEFDDGSRDLSGAANGVQTYVANKVLKVSSVQEATEAKASSYSIVLDGNGLGATVTDIISASTVDSNTWDISFPSNVDLIAEGFREGDKVNLSGAVSGVVNIEKFRAANVVRVGKVDIDLVTGTGSGTMNLASDEIVSILLDKTSGDYASFINREVYIYRAYFSEGEVVGEPFLLFKGIISGVGFDDSEDSLTVTWNMTSHWGDFSQVKGRITSDDSHRALDQNGIPQPQSALKIAYAYDKGFAHSETSLNILAQYSVQVEKQQIKAKKGFLGIGAKVKVKKYYVTESRDTELDFQLQAKAIPIIYGVRNTPGIPVFADTLNNDNSTVYVVQVLSEGEIGGIYDAYIDGNSLICNDKADFDTRSSQTPNDTVELICRGRADRGDVLGGVTSTANTSVPFYSGVLSNPSELYRIFNLWKAIPVQNYQPYVEPALTTTSTTGSGVVDGESIKLTSPQEIVLDVFSGKPGQKAASSLVEAAKANNFKIQNDYWIGDDTDDYWSPNHRLLDTAYIVSKFKIEEGETTIPTIDFVVRGKTVDCYNYDKSYSHYNKATGESADNFILGDYVDLRKTDGTILASNVQIIDKWTFRNTDGTPNTRFRFSIDPPLDYVNGVPSTTSFRMVKGSNTWTMITYNYVESEGVNSVQWLAQITGASNNNGYVQFSFAGDSSYTVGGDPLEESSAFSVVDASGNPVEADFFSNAVIAGAVTSTTLMTKYAWSAAGASAQSLVGKYLVRRNVLSIPAGSSTNGYYNGYQVRLIRNDLITGKRTVQQYKIIDYTSGIATIDGLWDYGYHPKNGDIVSLIPSYADSRVTINPAMQLMDYLTSVTYGRGLDPFDDLNFASWLDTARKCDEGSNVTIQTTSSYNINSGAVYKYPSSGPILWQGRVVGTENDYIEFTDVIGKLTNAWNSWKTYKIGELFYVDDKLYIVNVTGTIPTKPTGAGGNISLLSSLNLTKVSGTGPDNLSTKVDGNPIRAFKNGTTIPGYSLYDSDGVDYWRYLGWDEFSQRYVTKHQTNIIIDTSLPLLDNVNSLLEHFGGILRYSGGQYYLELEEAEGLISSDPTEPRNITSDHIIGKIRLTDEGIRSAYNSLTAAYADPANKFESRNISFFNSDYLKADKNVAKKGNITVPGITNYYNTRLLADKTLNKSRFGLQVSFNMTQRGTLLLSGQVIQLAYPRYNWTNKKFRILTLTHQEDATTDIVAEEYDDSFYGLSNISKIAGSGMAGNLGYSTGLGSPYNLVATNAESATEDILGIKLAWQNDSSVIGNKNAYTEIRSSFSTQLYLTASSVSSNTFTTLVDHGLKLLEPITVISSDNQELQSGVVYYIAATPSANTFQLSTTKGGAITGFTDDSDLALTLDTSIITATVPVTTTNYVDIVSGVDARIKKYYWVRHKILGA